MKPLSPLNFYVKFVSKRKTVDYGCRKHTKTYLFMQIDTQSIRIDLIKKNPLPTDSLAFQCD